MFHDSACLLYTVSQNCQLILVSQYTAMHLSWAVDDGFERTVQQLTRYGMKFYLLCHTSDNHILTLCLSLFIVFKYICNLWPQITPKIIKLVCNITNYINSKTSLKEPLLKLSAAFSIILKIFWNLSAGAKCNFGSQGVMGELWQESVTIQNGHQFIPCKVNRKAISRDHPSRSVIPSVFFHLAVLWLVTNLATLQK